MRGVVCTRLLGSVVLVGLLTTPFAIRAPAALPTPTPTLFPRCDFAPLPSTGPPGTRVRLVGTCYPIHSGRSGFVFFDEILVAEVRGDTPGNYSASFQVPVDAAIGAHRLSLRYSKDTPSDIVSVTFVVRSFCRGDCDGDGVVTISELVLGVGIALGKQPLSACAELDVDGGGTISVDELIIAINDAQNGCLIPFTPTATPSATPTLASAGDPCRRTEDCRRPELVCVEPGGFAGCGICRLEEDQCDIDADCTVQGDGLVCELQPMLGSDCLCHPTLLCIPGCGGDGDCEIGEQCTASHCVPRKCTGSSDCPRHFSCIQQPLNGHICRRSFCSSDADCEDGFCVDSDCYDSLGRCEVLPP